ncbi:MAG: CerR family C-terminal domain-containing protein [Pseudomonadota bacterium]|nr:CerR family C-terminal domain-containing protein [Pseudomonadota bacterium]
MMTRRADGKEKKSRILDSACAVFAERGYHAAKVADICRRAGANVAAVNYYFGDKSTLYVEAWQHTYRQCSRPDVSVVAGSSPEEQLRSYIHSLIKNFSDHGASGQFTRLYLMELANPTGLIHNLWHELIEPRRLVLLEIISEIMGAEVTEETVLFCDMSIVNQCRTLLTVRHSDLEYLLAQPISADLINRLADHIATFSLAGIKAVAKKTSPLTGVIETV